MGGGNDECEIIQEQVITNGAWHFFFVVTAGLLKRTRIIEQIPRHSDIEENLARNISKNLS